MERSEDLLESLFERGIQKPEAKPAQPDVREHSVGAQGVGQNRSDDKPARGRGHTPEALRAVREPRERFGELVHPDRIGVHQKVPAAHFAALGEMHQGAGAVVDVNG